MAVTLTKSQILGASFDAGLRAYMVRVYNYLTLGLALSAASAFLIHGVSTTRVHVDGATAFGKDQWLTPLGHALYGWPGLIGLLVVGIGLIFAMRSAVDRASFSTAFPLYLAFTAAFGLCLAAMAGRHAPAVVIQTLAITATVFGATSLYGYTTKRDLSGLESFLFMGLVGLVGVGILNVAILHSSLLVTLTSAFGVLLFVGYTAYDTQTIKESYDSRMTSDAKGAAAVWGAMSLYLDVANLFGDLLNLLGDGLSGIGGGIADIGGSVGDAVGDIDFGGD